VDPHEVSERDCGFASVIGQLQQQFLGAVVQAGADEVARQLGHRRVAITRIDAGLVDERLVHADRRDPPRRADGTGYQARNACRWSRRRWREAEEHFERAFRLVVEQESQAFEVAFAASRATGGAGTRHTLQ